MPHCIASVFSFSFTLGFRNTHAKVLVRWGGINHAPWGDMHIRHSELGASAVGELEFGLLVVSTESLIISYAYMPRLKTNSPVPLAERTRALSVHAFKFLSASGCMLSNIMQDRVDFPNALFAGLLHPELLNRIFADPKDPTVPKKIKVCVFVHPLIMSWKPFSLRCPVSLYTFAVCHC